MANQLRPIKLTREDAKGFCNPERLWQSRCLRNFEHLGLLSQPSGHTMCHNEWPQTEAADLFVCARKAIQQSPQHCGDYIDSVENHSTNYAVQNVL